MGTRELVEQARLSDACFAGDCDDLTVPLPRLVKRPSKLLDFWIPSDEAREPAGNGGLQARPYRPGTCDLVYLDGLVALSQAERAAGLAAGVGREEQYRVILNGVAKTYAMTGWRVGWMIGPSDVTSMYPSASRNVSPGIRIVPGAAICSIRAARWVVWPTAV